VRPSPRFSVKRLGLPLLLALGLGACALTFDARSLGVQATMASPATEPAVGDTFRVTRTALHLFWGLYESRGADLQNALATQLGGNGGVANLRVRTWHKWSDILATVLTLGIVVPTSVTFEGVITRAVR
jgi:hypothetical protein